LLDSGLRWYRSFGYFSIHIIMAAAFSLAILMIRDTDMAIGYIGGTLILYIALVKRIDYLDPLVGYFVPWIILLFFSITRLSQYAISIHVETYSLVILALIGAMFAAGGRPHKISKTPQWTKPIYSRLNPRVIFVLIDVLFFSFTLLNIVIAGYVPLIRGLSGGGTGYMDFGVHGVYGFYLALANALAIVNFIIYLRTGKRIHFIRYIIILAIFVIFITRQNLISVAVESVIVYSIVRGRIRWRAIFVGTVLAGIIFSLIGSFRSGSVREIAGIETKYSWIPEPVIWLYAYSYFNIANMDNLIVKSDAPYYNASSLSSLIPSFLRPEYDAGDYLLLGNFNVSSYMFPVYKDMGRVGVFLLTLIALRLTAKKYQLLDQTISIGQVGSYSVLYFCASFSFFFNFWFYLPIIFQVVFFNILNNVSERACLLTEKQSQSFRLQNLGHPQMSVR
jgi:oligosaccharide repeat unit polymerase